MPKERTTLLRLMDVSASRREAGVKAHETFIVRKHIHAAKVAQREERIRQAELKRYIVHDDWEDRPIGS